ncbi:MAG: rod shape-determining protein MreD [Microthrixaceae bacterium]
MAGALVIGWGTGARWALVVAAAFVVQIGLVTQIRVFGVVPDTLVVLSVCAGLSGGPQRGAVVGFWLGILFDLPRPMHPLGISALAYLVVAALAGVAQAVVLQSGRLMSIVIVAACSVFGVLVFAVESAMFGGHAFANPQFGTILLTTALVGAVLARPGLRLAGWADGPDVRSVAK